MIGSITKDELLEYGGFSGRFEAEQKNFVAFRTVQVGFEHFGRRKNLARRFFKLVLGLTESSASGWREQVALLAFRSINDLVNRNFDWQQTKNEGSYQSLVQDDRMVPDGSVAKKLSNSKKLELDLRVSGWDRWVGGRLSSSQGSLFSFLF